jgi:hypothetical protein
MTDRKDPRYFEASPNSDKERAFRAIVLRSYKIDPMRTESDLLRMKRQDILTIIKVDAAMGRDGG